MKERSHSNVRFVMHIAAVHEGKKPFKCETCDATFARKNKFTRKDNLNTHIATVHEEMKPFKCDLCNTKFTSKHSLNGHIAAVHEGKSHSNVTLVRLNLHKNLI